MPVRTRGGWIQLDIRPAAGWQAGGAYGLDDPKLADLPLSGRGRNATYTAHQIWQPGGGVLLGAEFRHIRTAYNRGTLATDHLNLYAGLSF